MYRRLAAAVLLTGITLVVFATPALAHAELIASTPAENATLAAAPTRIELTFSEPVTLPDHPIEVIGPGDATWRIGTPTIAGPVVSIPVAPSGPAGRYTLAYRVTSADGDTVGGSITFTLSAAAAPSTDPETSSATASPAASAQPSGTAPAAGDGGTLLWVWLVGGAVLLSALVAVTLRVRRPGR